MLCCQGFSGDSFGLCKMLPGTNGSGWQDTGATLKKHRQGVERPCSTLCQCASETEGTGAVEPVLTCAENDRRAEELEDAEIIGRILGGEVNAFELLLVRYQGFVRGIVLRHVPAGRVEEVAHEAFIAAYRALPAYSARSDFKWWLARIAVRRCCDFWRERERRREVLLSEVTEEHHKWMDNILASSSADAFARAAEQKEAKEVLEHALAGSSAKDRTVLTLVYLDGYSVEEAAELLGWNTVLVRVRAHRAKARMRKAIVKLLRIHGESDEKER
jgi:RNA polymerase sigma-70 factor (ECF subfamily)